MGVLACDRKGCENIMCDRHSHKYGYICSECFDELKSNKSMSISEFMASEKDNYAYSERGVKLEDIFKDKSGGLNES